MSATGEGAPRLTRLGRYELITRIGQGGMAEVQLALQRGPAGFEKLVVVKLVHESLATQKAFVDMLLDEARVAALVKHPNVVDIYDLGEANGRYFIAMEYLEGEPLLAVLRAGREGKRLDPLSTGRLIADTAEGLDAAHELRSMSGEPLELVHHDISLGNIVVLYNGQVKLVDFGVAKATQSASTKAKVQGKFSYMAPEKLKGAQGDRRSDIFSLGCVMWEALTLKRLFKGSTDSETMNQILEMNIQPPSKVNGDVPVEFDAIVMRALSRDPERRPKTAKALGVELEEMLAARGYGAKNDRVAKYMQETFKSHIDARKKLVQEVVAKGSASAEVVDAAFSPMLAGGSPITPSTGGEFALAAGSSGSFSRPQTFAPPPVHSVRAPIVAPSSGVPTPANAFSDASRPTEIRAPVFDIVAEEDFISKIIPMSGPFWQDPRRLAMAGSGAGVLAMMVIVIAIAAGRGSGSPAVSAKPVATAGGDDRVMQPIGSDDHPVAPGSGSETVKAAGSDAVKSSGSDTVKPSAGSADGSNIIEMANDPIDGPGSAHPTGERGGPSHKPPPPPVNAEAMFKQGLQAFVKGDNKAALAALQKAKGANPGFAPTWRVLGQVYEKLGDHSAAKTSFQRYLKLAPSASDADQIRARIDRL